MKKTLSEREKDPSLLKGEEPILLQEAKTPSKEKGDKKKKRYSLGYSLTKEGTLFLYRGFEVRGNARCSF